MVFFKNELTLTSSRQLWMSSGLCSTLPGSLLSPNPPILFKHRIGKADMAEDQALGEIILLMNFHPGLKDFGTNHSLK